MRIIYSAWADKSKSALSALSGGEQSGIAMGEKQKGEAHHD